MFLGGSFLLHAQFRDFGTSQLASGQTSLTFSDAFSSANNPSALSFLDSVQLAVGYQNRFLLKALGYQAIFLAVPTKKTGAFGAYYAHTGIDVLSENLIGVSYAIKLSPKTSLGLGLKTMYFNNPTPYQDYILFTGILGIYVMPTDKINISAIIDNPTLSKQNAQDVFPIRMSIEGLYKAYKHLNLRVQATQVIGEAFYISGGLQYRLSEVLSLSVGVTTQSLSPTMGVSVRLKKISISSGFLYNQVLGPVSSLDIIVKL